MTKKNYLLKKLLAFLLIAFTLLGCNRDVIIARDRTQAQSVELIALLNKFGISASSNQTRNNKTRFDVSVPERYQAQANTLLHENSLAGEPEFSIQDLISTNSFLPGPRAVEMFKLDLARASLVEQALKNIDVVSSAKVIIRQNFNDPGAQPSGTVVVSVKEGQKASEEQIRSVVQTALPEIKNEHLVVIVSEAQNNNAELTLAGAKNVGNKVINVPLRDFLYWQVPEGEFNGLAWTFIITIIITAFVFGAIGYFSGYFRYAKPSNTQQDELGLIGSNVNNQNKNLIE